MNLLELKNKIVELESQKVNLGEVKIIFQCPDWEFGGYDLWELRNLILDETNLNQGLLIMEDLS